MTKKEYLDKRNAMLAEAESLLNEGKTDECKAKQADVEALDNQWDDIAKEMANLNAMKDQIIVNLDNQTIAVKEAKNVEILDNKPMAMTVDSNEYRNAFLKKLQGKELTQMENTAVSAASVIPTTTLNKIVEILEQTSSIYNKITVTNIPSNITIPVEGTNNDASWVAMGTASTDSEDTMTYVSLAAYKLIKTVEITADVQAMGIDAFEAWLTKGLAKKIAKAVEAGVVTGDGSAKATGLLKSGEITNTGTFTKAGMTYADLMAILAALPTEYHSNATIVLPRALFFGDLIGMEDATGRPVVIPDVEAPSKFSVLGYPVIINDRMTADYLLFGDLSYYHWNWAKDVTISSDDSVGFRTGSRVYRAMALADGKKTSADAFVLYTRAS